MIRPPDHDVRMQRALRSLEGLSVGDAFGEQLLAEPRTILRRMQRREIMPGMWPYSDDTVMAMSIVESLHHHGRIDQEWLALRFARKYQLDPTRGYGSTANMVLADIARGRHWRHAAGAAFGGKGSMGNGGAMRAAPIGAYFAGDPAAAAALWCACHRSEDYPGALWTAVSRFGDCDTLCAIVGGIVVMKHGEAAIPDEWRQRREPLSAMLRLDRPSR